FSYSFKVILVHEIDKICPECSKHPGHIFLIFNEQRNKLLFIHMNKSFVTYSYIRCNCKNDRRECHRRCSTSDLYLAFAYFFTKVTNARCYYLNRLRRHEHSYW